VVAVLPVLGIDDLPKPVAYSIAIFALFGFLAGVGALAARGSVDTMAMSLTGTPAIFATTGIMALVGLLFGLILLLLFRALKMAAENDPRWRK
jgi:hypothetical protein